MQASLASLEIAMTPQLRDEISALSRTPPPATDRLSAFDRIIALVPYKGQVLNQLSMWWFEQTRDIVANHALSTPDPNVLIARRSCGRRWRTASTTRCR